MSRRKLANPRENGVTLRPSDSRRVLQKYRRVSLEHPTGGFSILDFKEVFYTDGGFFTRIRQNKPRHAVGAEKLGWRRYLPRLEMRIEVDLAEKIACDSFLWEKGLGHTVQGILRFVSSGARFRPEFTEMDAATLSEPKSWGRGVTSNVN